jgi:glycosyltransferase involved in cell wall biosynthesis
VLSGVSVIVPVFNSSDTLIVLVHEVQEALQSLGSFEIILVDDGSSNEETWKTIANLSQKESHVRGMRLGRNFGQHNALVAGIRNARMTVTVTIDDDLQNPPAEIPKLLRALVQQNLDVVYGVPTNVQQGFSRRIAGKVTRVAMSSGLGVDHAPDVSSFRIFHTRLREAFSGEIGTNVSLDALLTWGGSRFGSVSVMHRPRLVGASNYSFTRLTRFAMDTITGYSTLPLQVASILGFTTALFGIFILVLVTVRPLLSGDSVPGFPFLASTIAIFSGVQLLTLGVLGEYLARMHFRVMRKPTYMVRQSTEELFDSPEDAE